ncbi:MAG: hypothetical protein NZM29_04060 [Nitrospira sp.]|nr:hypothetical protein [Nitrospira sp.]
MLSPFAPLPTPRWTGCRVVLIGWVIVILSSSARADELAELLKRVPGDMNTVAVINVREINKSPRAMREKWRDHRETEYLAGAVAVPPWVPTVVIGASLQVAELTTSRSLLLVPMENAANSETIARRENGVVQTVDDLTLVLSPKRGYFGFPAAGIIGISANMTRQEFARWVRGARKPERPALSPFLQEAVAAHRDAHILIALDLQDALDPTAVRQGLQRSGVVRSETLLDSLVRVLSGLRGLIVTIRIDDRSPAEFRFEFGVPMEEFLTAMQGLWPPALTALGLDIDELKNARARADGKAIIVSTELSDRALRLLLSVVYAAGAESAADERTVPKITSAKESAMLAASLRYYRAVNAALDDLRASGDARSKDYNRSAALFDNFAARIEKLPIADVDPLLIQYGNSVAAKLRSMAGSLRGIKMQLEAYDSYKSTTWAGSSGGFLIGPRGWGIGLGGGGVALSTNVQELNTRQAELVAQLEAERAKLLSVIQSDRSAIRKEMLDKYKIDFEQYKR